MAHELDERFFSPPRLARQRIHRKAGRREVSISRKTFTPSRLPVISLSFRMGRSSLFPDGKEVATVWPRRSAPITLPALMPALPPGRIRDTPADFVVEEIPAYEPTGQGEHVYVRFTKRNLTTLEAVPVSRALSGANLAKRGSPG